MEIWKMLKNLKIQLIVNKVKYGKPVLRYNRNENPERKRYWKKSTSVFSRYWKKTPYCSIKVIDIFKGVKNVQTIRIVVRIKKVHAF